MTLIYAEKKKSGMCLEVENRNGVGKAHFAPCDPKNEMQKFKINKIESK
jgi:hypothetical protein